MPSAPSARPGADPTAGPVHLIVALAAELGGLHGGRDPGWRMTRCGPGAAAAAAAARTAIRAGAGGLLVWGFAGGIAPHLACGSIVLPRYVVDADGRRYATDLSWRERLQTALPAQWPTEPGDLACVAAVASTPQAKQRIRAATGAVAVDMESGAVAAVAAAAGIPCVVLKVVIDGPTDALPGGIEGWVDDAGRARLAAWLRALLRPAAWPALGLLLKRYRQARGRLNALARRCAAQNFLLAAPPVRT